METITSASSAYRAELVDWDDGHTPGAANAPTKMVVQTGKHSSEFMAIFDHLLPPLWCERMYNYAVELNKPWGSYVTTGEILDETINVEGLWLIDPEKAMSLIVTRKLFFGRGRHFLEGDIGNIHGTAVWCLTSGFKNAVEYHIDYAELFRYETGIIQPPLYAGTCQVSPVRPGDMAGGDFAVNLDGLDHYKLHGYKGKLSSPDGVMEELNSYCTGGVGNWNIIKYTHNRGIMHDGDFPHVATPITNMADDSPAKKRVILGLNCFPASVGECCLRAPEHSQAFNRTVKLYQTVANITGDKIASLGSKYGSISVEEAQNGSKDDTLEGQSAAVPVKKGFSVADVKKNPALTKLLLAAARRVKDVEAKKKEGSSLNSI